MKYLVALLLLIAIPANAVESFFAEGIASWYSLPGRRTASGEMYDPNKLTAAHRTLAFGTRVKVEHNDKSVIVRINDRGPFNGRVIDLSRAAAQQIGLVARGTGRVTLTLQ